ncbi:MAG: hypothetical protein SVO26_08215 [Chloroflexota bacterium]|nr:hypothetical protein [Chloroflexota bacterium]
MPARHSGILMFSQPDIWDPETDPGGDIVAKPYITGTGSLRAF